jgi:hypothetical protein
MLMNPFSTGMQFKALERFSDPHTEGVPIFPLGKIETDIEVIFLA